MRRWYIPYMYSVTESLTPLHARTISKTKPAESHSSWMWTAPKLIVFPRYCVRNVWHKFCRDWLVFETSRDQVKCQPPRYDYRLIIILNTCAAKLTMWQQSLFRSYTRYVGLCIAYVVGAAEVGEFGSQRPVLNIVKSHDGRAGQQMYARRQCIWRRPRSRSEIRWKSIRTRAGGSTRSWCVQRVAPDGGPCWETRRRSWDEVVLSTRLRVSPLGSCQSVSEIVQRCWFHVNCRRKCQNLTLTLTLVPGAEIYGGKWSTTTGESIEPEDETVLVHSYYT